MSKVDSYTLKELRSSNRNIMENAFNIIYKTYAPLVSYVAFDILHNKEDMEDIVNETFLKMFEHRYLLKDDKSLKSFLTTIAHNAAINKAKLNQYNAPLEVEVASESTSDQVSDFNSFIAKYKSFLDEEEIKYLVLHLLYDFSFKEIAAFMKSSVNSISSKYRRAIQKIKAHYKEAK